MGKSIKQTGKSMSMPGGLAMGAAVSLLLTIVGAFALSSLLEMEKLEWKNIGYGIAAILITASFAGAATASGKIKRRRLLVCMESSCIYFGMLLLITALFFGGQYEAVGVTAAVVAAGGTCAALAGGALQGRQEHARGKGRRYIKSWKVN